MIPRSILLGHEIRRALGRQLALPRRVGRLESRVRLIATDLDCDAEGSLAETLAELHADVTDLRARVAELDVGIGGPAPGARAPRWPG